MAKSSYVQLGRGLAIVSFIIATVLFLSYYFSSSSDLLVLAFICFLLLGLINLGFLFTILLNLNEDTQNRKKLAQTAGLMLLNIPIACFYIWKGSQLLNTMIITFENATGENLENIEIIGCGGGHIDALAAGEQTTVWVEITGDCSIRLAYPIKGELKEEVVAEYVTGMMGQRVSSKIDGQDQDVFLK